MLGVWRPVGKSRLTGDAAADTRQAPKLSGSSWLVSETGAPPFPAELVEAIAALLADARVADIRQYPTLAKS